MTHSQFCVSSRRYSPETCNNKRMDKHVADPSLSPELIAWMDRVRSCRRGTINGKRHPHQPAILQWFLLSAAAERPRTVAWSEGKQQWREEIKSHGGGGSPESPITALVNGKVLQASQPLSRTASSPSARAVLDTTNPLIGLPESVWSLVVSDEAAKSSLIKFIATQLD
jgi:hypothetical protein